MRTLVLLAFGAWAASAAGQEPNLFFSKKFPGSKPAYVEITVEKGGAVVYKEAPDDELPVRFKIKPEQAQAMYMLAEKLEKFARPIESGLKVARMGDKTFRWTEGDAKTEALFNYTTDPDAQTLLDWFERLSESAGAFIELEKTARFDRLGVNKSILQLEILWDKKRLLGLEQYLPLLDRVAKNDGYLNMARERAAKLAEIFRNPPPPAPAAEAKAQ